MYVCRGFLGDHLYRVPRNRVHSCIVNRVPRPSTTIGPRTAPQHQNCTAYRVQFQLMVALVCHLAVSGYLLGGSWCLWLLLGCAGCLWLPAGCFLGAVGRLLCFCRVPLGCGSCVLATFGRPWAYPGHPIDVGSLGGIPSIPPSPHVSILAHPSIPPS